MGKLYFRYGCMGSTKSLNLLTTAYQFDEKGIICLAFKPSIDNRGVDGVISSRIEGLERKCISVSPSDNLYKAIEEYVGYQKSVMEKPLEWILVDECQFLTEEQVDQLAEIVDSLDINVMCYGLQTDFKSNSFAASRRLFELADSIEEVKSSCSCGRKAIINARINEDGKVLSSGEQILIGGNDKYIALCRKCWKEKLRERM